jgi:hypothetical protein
MHSLLSETHNRLHCLCRVCTAFRAVHTIRRCQLLVSSQELVLIGLIMLLLHRCGASPFQQHKARAGGAYFSTWMPWFCDMCLLNVLCPGMRENEGG